jgi:hypothetical protein
MPPDVSIVRFEDRGYGIADRQIGLSVTALNGFDGIPSVMSFK